MYRRMFRLWMFLKSVGLGITDGQCRGVARGSACHYPFAFRATITSGQDLDVTPGSSDPDPAPVVGTVTIPAVESVEAVKLSTPPLSGQLSPASPQAVAWEDLGNSSVPLSPNRVQAGRSQDVPEEGSLFHVSPVSPLSSFRRLGCCCRRFQ